jgi:hypothetical protein
MKKSSFILVLFIIVMVWGRFLLVKPEPAVSPMVIRTKKMDNFSVVVAQPGSNVLLQSQWATGNDPKFTYMTNDNELFSTPSYKVQNDTLFIFSSSGDKEHRNDSFYCIGVKSIVGLEKSNINLGYFKSDTLHIKLRNARLSGDFDHSTKKPRLLMLEADSSKIVFRSLIRFKQINVQLNRSHLEIPVARFDSVSITGTLVDYSRLSVDGRPMGKLAKDATSYSNL